MIFFIHLIFRCFVNLIKYRCFNLFGHCFYEIEEFLFMCNIQLYSVKLYDKIEGGREIT